MADKSVATFSKKSDAVTFEFFNHLHPDFCMSQISKAVIDLSNPTKNTRT